MDVKKPKMNDPIIPSSFWGVTDLKLNVYSLIIKIPIIKSRMADKILIYVMYEYTRDVKNPVNNIITTKMLRRPKMNDAISIFVFDFKLKARIIGMMGNMHGDNIEITPVKKERKGRISI